MPVNITRLMFIQQLLRRLLFIEAFPVVNFIPIRVVFSLSAEIQKLKVPVFDFLNREIEVVLKVVRIVRVVVDVPKHSVFQLEFNIEELLEESLPLSS